MSIKASLSFHLCRFFADRKLKPELKEDCVYLTFDDGPEPGITEFVLEELRKHGAKATFFCCGYNCDEHNDLLQQVIQEGHVIANHTYSHIKGLTTKTADYITDVEKGAKATNSHLFRPPWAGATFGQYCKLSRKHKFVYWGVVSGDTQRKKFNLDANLTRLKSTSLGGKIILFHFCKKHESETRQILPLFLELVESRGLKFGLIK